jgi:hypothetical protein
LLHVLMMIITRPSDDIYTSHNSHASQAHRNLSQVRPTVNIHSMHPQFFGLKESPLATNRSMNGPFELATATPVVLPNMKHIM